MTCKCRLSDPSGAEKEDDPPILLEPTKKSCFQLPLHEIRVIRSFVHHIGYFSANLANVLAKLALSAV